VEAMNRRCSGLVVIIFLGLQVAPSGVASAQANDSDSPSAMVNPADVETLDGIMTALYASISGPIGQERDFARFKSLFAPDGRLQPTSARAPKGYASWTPEDYWGRNATRLAEIGFTEAEIGRQTQTFGNITHVFSSYESYRLDQGEPEGPFARGINSIQIIRHQDRFWILSLAWDSERPDNQIPAKYMGG
jgi:hypothetical protein